MSGCSNLNSLQLYCSPAENADCYQNQVYELVYNSQFWSIEGNKTVDAYLYHADNSQVAMELAGIQNSGVMTFTVNNDWFTNPPTTTTQYYPFQWYVVGAGKEFNLWSTSTSFGNTFWAVQTPTGTSSSAGSTYTGGTTTLSVGVVNPPTATPTTTASTSFSTPVVPIFTPSASPTAGLVSPQGASDTSSPTAQVVSQSHSGLSGGAIAGIVIAVLLALGAFAVAAFFFTKRKAQTKDRIELDSGFPSPRGDIEKSGWVTTEKKTDSTSSTSSGSTVVEVPLAFAPGSAASTPKSSFIMPSLPAAAGAGYETPRSSLSKPVVPEKDDASRDSTQPPKSPNRELIQAFPVPSGPPSPALSGISTESTRSNKPTYHLAPVVAPLVNQNRPVQPSVPPALRPGQPRGPSPTGPPTQGPPPRPRQGPPPGFGRERPPYPGAPMDPPMGPRRPRMRGRHGSFDGPPRPVYPQPPRPMTPQGRPRPQSPSQYPPRSMSPQMHRAQSPQPRSMSPSQMLRSQSPQARSMSPSQMLRSQSPQPRSMNPQVKPVQSAAQQISATLVQARAQSPFDDPLTPTNLGAPLLSDPPASRQPIPVNVQNVQAQPVAVVTRQNSKKAASPPFALAAPPARKPVKPLAETIPETSSEVSPPSSVVSTTVSAVSDVPVAMNKVAVPQIPAIQRPTSVKSQMAKVEGLEPRASVSQPVAPRPEPKVTAPPTPQAPNIEKPVPRVSFSPPSPAITEQSQALATPTSSAIDDELAALSTRTSLLVEVPSRTPSLEVNPALHNTRPLAISKLEAPETEEEPDTPSSSILGDAPSLPILEHGRPLSLGFGL